MTYEEPGLLLRDDELVIRRYYFPFGSKRIRFSEIREARLRKAEKLRVWGSSDFVHWYNLDVHRPRKETAIELDLGRRCKPVITPDDPETIIDTLRAGAVRVVQG